MMADQVTDDAYQGPDAARARSLADILMMTEDMVEAARNNEWDKVTKMEERRRNALAECFRSPVPEEHTELFSAALAAMLHLNEELIALVEEAKSAVAIKRTDQNRTSKSLGHYLDIESTH